MLSPTTALHQKVSELKAQGRSIHDFSVGEPRFSWQSELLEKALSGRFREEYAHYPPVKGLDKLRKLILRKFSGNTGDCLVTAGAKAGLYFAILSLLQKDEEVLVPGPAWPSYQAMISFGKARMIPVIGKSPGLEFPLEELKSKITSKTRMLILNPVSNPCGTIIPLEVMQTLVELCSKNNIILLSDEVYSPLGFERTQHSFCNFLNEYENILVFQSLSKAYALPGLRLGWVMAQSGFIEKMAGLQSQSYTCAAHLSQLAALNILNDPDFPVEKIRLELLARRDLVFETLKSKLELHKPQGGLYYFFKVPESFNMNADSFCLELLLKHDIALVSGSSFGAPYHLRLSYGGETQDLRKDLKAFEAVLNSFH